MTPMLCSRLPAIGRRSDDAEQRSKGGLDLAGRRGHLHRHARAGRCGTAGWSSARDRSCCSQHAGAVRHRRQGLRARATTRASSRSPITLPEGYTLDRADEVFTEIERRLRKLPRRDAHVHVIGDTTGRVTKGQGDVTRATIYCPADRPATSGTTRSST